MADRPGKKRGLGRGLSALMADVTESEATATRETSSADRTVPIEQIIPNPDQPRKRFAPDDLADLTASIREKGVIQPLIVRPLSDGNFGIVAGERRWRAAQEAQLHELPVLVREFSDTEVLEIAIIENIQRADLNPIEEAAGFRQLMDRFGHTQEQLSQALGKSRSHIANLLRLLNLPEGVVEMLRTGDLSAGHARALVPADNALALAKQIVAQGLSVRETEALVKRQNAGPEAPTKGSDPKPKAEKDADTRALEADLSAAIGMSVVIDHGADGDKGKLVVSYKSLDDLDNLCRLLSGG